MSCLADEVREDALYDSRSICDFVGNDLPRKPISDATIPLKFQCPLLASHLTKTLFDEINAHLSEKGLLVQAGNIVDATIIAAPSSTKNAEGARDGVNQKGQLVAFRDEGTHWRRCRIRAGARGRGHIAQCQQRDAGRCAVARADTRGIGSAGRRLSAELATRQKVLISPIINYWF